MKSEQAIREIDTYCREMGVSTYTDLVDALTDITFKATTEAQQTAARVLAGVVGGEVAADVVAQMAEISESEPLAQPRTTSFLNRYMVQGREAA